MSKLDEKRIKELSASVAKLSMGVKPKAKEAPKAYKPKDLSFTEKYKPNLPPIKETVIVTDNTKVDDLTRRIEILENEETQEEEVGVDVKEVIDALKQLKGNDRLDISNIRNGENLASMAAKAANSGFNMNDQRWHGAGGSGSSITSINGDTTAAQILATGTSGTDFAIVDNGTGTHTFNLPTASGTNRGALSSADWTTFNNKGSGTVTSVATGTGLTGGPISTTGTVSLNTKLAPMDTLTGNSLKVLRVNAGETAVEYATNGSGTVTSVSVTTANGVSGSVADPTTTPAITLSLGAITPTTTNGLTITPNGTNTLNIQAGKTLATNGSITLTGTDSQTYTFPTTSATVARTDAGNTFTGSSTTSGWVETSPTITTKISPTSDDGAPLGDTTHNFSDLFLASGAVINYANGNVALTHSSGILTLGTGTLKITTPTNNTTSVVTTDGTQTLSNKTLSGVTALADAATTSMIVPTVDGTATGPTTSAFVSGYTSSAIGDLVYLDSNGKWQKTDADAASTASNLLGIALAVAATDAALLVALPGSIVYATAFPTMTIGVPMYVGESAGAIQAAIPTGADNVIRVVGFAVHADKLFFYPSQDNQTTVA